MKRSKWLVVVGTVVLLITGAALLSFAADPSAHAYVGADKCKMCHNSPAKGAQYTKWTESKHSKAFEALASDEAKKFATAKGIPDPQKADQCLKCHATNNGQLADKVAQGVTCEGCHGAGADYMKMDVMKDQAKAVAAGMVMPKEDACKGCHNADSPSFKGFDFASASQKIAHPNPAKAAK